jgi:hypothetical protein
LFKFTPRFLLALFAALPPQVMAAIAETTKNPMAIFNYQNDPEVGGTAKQYGGTGSSRYRTHRAWWHGQSLHGFCSRLFVCPQVAATCSQTWMCTLDCSAGQAFTHSIFSRLLCFPFPAPAGHARV